LNLTYPATITPDTNGQWLVTFTDIPEATSSGDSEEDALAHAPAALETALEFYTDEGRDPPTPSKGRAGDYMVSPSGLVLLKPAVYPGIRN